MEYCIAIRCTQSDYKHKSMGTLNSIDSVGLQIDNACVLFVNALNFLQLENASCPLSVCKIVAVECRNRVISYLPGWHILDGLVR